MIRGALRLAAAASIAVMSLGQGLIGGIPTAHAGLPFERIWLWPLADKSLDVDQDPNTSQAMRRFVGLNPTETVEDAYGLTGHVWSSTASLSMVTAINGTSHQGCGTASGQPASPDDTPIVCEPPNVPTTRGSVGVVYWNPVTNKFKWYGAVPSGFTA